MEQHTADYFDNIFRTMRSIRVTDKNGGHLSFSRGIEEAVNLILSQTCAAGKVMFIGNGGSAAISSHMSTDFSKNGGVRAIAFNDSALLTCMGNDYGYQHVFEKPIEMFAENGDVLVAISSSGSSENILLGAQAARSKGCKVITLSGFGSDNPLSFLGDFNFYVPSNAYGPVEVIHHSICHCLLDTLMRVKNG